MYLSTKKFGPFACAFRQPDAVSHCRFIHGYGLVFQIDFAADKLDENGWVVDFGGLKELKASFEKTFDHKTVIKITDPHYHRFEELHNLEIVDLLLVNDVGCEAFARIGYELATRQIKLMGLEPRVRVVKSEVWEHPTNSASFVP